MNKKANRGFSIVLLLLIGVTAALLYALRDGDEDPGSAETPPPPHGIGPASQPTAPARSALPAPARDTPSTTVRRAVEPSPADAGAAKREPLGVHSARSAVPVQIAEEKDPRRRAQLMRMHQLAVARSRASRLRRRRRLLRTTLHRARQDKNWSADRIHRTENDLRELQVGIEEAEERVHQAEERARPTGSP